MKFRISVFLLMLISTALLVADVSSAKVYIAEPDMVQQPSYAGMTFYVYKPHGMQKDWFLTFDGYAVTQTQGKVWVYGTMQSEKLTKTNYVVGSVNPALAGIVPYFGANSTYTAGQIETNHQIVGQPNQTLGAVPNQTAKQTYIPDWSVNPAFLAISNWKNTVDRIGIMNKYNVPIAWMGNRPKVIYAWTGKKWKQIETHNGRISDTINLNLYGLMKEVEKDKRYRWYLEDVPILTEKTISWGYLWMGEIFAKN